MRREKSWAAKHSLNIKAASVYRSPKAMVCLSHCRVWEVENTVTASLGLQPAVQKL